GGATVPQALPGGFFFARLDCREFGATLGRAFVPPSATEAFMHERRSRTADAPHAPASDPPRRPPHSGWVRWPAPCAAILVSSCQQTGILVPQGPIASAQLLLLLNATAIMLVVVVPVILATLAFAWWYRSSNPRAIRCTDEGYEGRTEFVTWSIPVL